MSLTNSIAIVVSPLKMLSLKLDTLGTPRSGWMDVSSRHGKALLFRMNGKAYLYFSPYTKESLAKEVYPGYSYRKNKWAKSFLWKSIDTLDTIVTRFLKWVRSKFTKKKEETPHDAYGFPHHDHINAKESDRLLKERREFINKLKRGKVADRVEVLSNSEYQGTIESMNKMRDAFHKHMNEKMDLLSDRRPKDADPMKIRFADLLSNSMDSHAMDSLNDGKTYQEWMKKKGTFTVKASAFEEALFDKSSPHFGSPSILDIIFSATNTNQR